MPSWMQKLSMTVVVLFALTVITIACYAGPVRATEGYKVLAPISTGNLTIFPVVASSIYNTDFLTLDEGLLSGQVVVTEAGRVPPMIRRRRNLPLPSGDEVNRLVLVNNSNKPLILLAGEVVTGGKQDRVIGKDRIVPANSDPVDLSVFCVEPGRWTEKTSKFGVLSMQMAQPTIRMEAMRNKDQTRVWAKVGENNRAMAAGAVGGSIANESGSFATVMESKAAQDRVDTIARPIEKSYASTVSKLRERNAVGVIVAVNGEIICADIFANAALLEKYWPKLVRSYAAESIVAAGRAAQASIRDAERFIAELDGNRQVVETEPGVYRHSEISGDGYVVFELISLLGKSGFDVHITKLAGTDDAPVIGNMRR